MTGAESRGGFHITMRDSVRVIRGHLLKGAVAVDVQVSAAAEGEEEGVSRPGESEFES